MMNQDSAAWQAPDAERQTPNAERVMFRRLIWVIDETPHRAALNMAIDEALLLGGGDCPLFRSYHWLQRPVSIGYFSSWEQASVIYPGREIVRRWTGGGVVEHGTDFTYSLLLPVDSGPPPNRDLYRGTHAAIVKALAAMGHPAAVVAKDSEVRAETNLTTACFEKSVESDVEIDGLKVAGAAIRRLRAGVILQGSIQRVPVGAGFAPRLAQTLSRTVEKTTLSTVTTSLAERIATLKYGTESWTRRY
jgi:lipoyl(octanoyl) transferase